MDDDFLPPGLMKAIVTKCDSINNGKLRVHDIRPEAVEPFKAALSDKSLNFAQKERLSAAILQGNYSLASPRSLSSVDTEKHAAQLRARDMAHLNRHAYHAPVLGVASRPAKLLPPEAQDMKKLQINRCANLGKGAKVFTWNKSEVPTVPLHVPTEARQGPPTDVAPVQEYCTKRDAQINYKLRGAEQVKALRHVASDWNGQYAEARRKQITYQRKVVAFRQKLFERLKERNDPQISYIMRTIDNTVIEEFIDKFKGCSMSVDAIISNMGHTLPISTPNRCVGDLLTVPIEEEQAAQDYARPGEADVFQFTASMHDDHIEGFPEEPSIESLHMSYSQLSARTGSSGGSSSSPSRYKKVDKHRSATTGDMRCSPTKKTGIGSFGASRRDPQILVNPRPVVSRGAGFRAANSKASADDPGGYTSSAALRSRAEGALTGSSLRLLGTPSRRPESPDTDRIVDIMRSHMAAEGMLQSGQPDRVLTEEELGELASGNKSFESIADSLSSSSKSSPKASKERQLGKVVIGSRKPPKALKTIHAMMTDTPEVTPVPYKTNFRSPTANRPIKMKRSKRREATSGSVDYIRPMSSTNYGGLYVISSYKEEHPVHQAAPPHPSELPPA